VGNHAVTQLKERGERWPGKTYREPKNIPLNGLQKIMESAKEMEGWRGDMAYMIVSLYPACGLRHSELRTAQLEDLYRKDNEDGTEMWYIKVRHPKGEGRYGRRRQVWVLPFAYDAIRRYLPAREQYLAKHGVQSSLYLFPCLYTGDIEQVYSEKEFRLIKKQVQEKCGFEFKIKDFRSSYGQLFYNMDRHAAEYVSTLMGHASIETTNRYYANMTDVVAIENAQLAWATSNKPTKNVEIPTEPKEQVESPKADKKGAIGSKNWLPGYG